MCVIFSPDILLAGAVKGLRKPHVDTNSNLSYLDDLQHEYFQNWSVGHVQFGQVEFSKTRCVARLWE